LCISANLIISRRLEIRVRKCCKSIVCYFGSNQTHYAKLWRRQSLRL